MHILPYPTDLRILLAQNTMENNSKMGQRTLNVQIGIPIIVYRLYGVPRLGTVAVYFIIM